MIKQVLFIVLISLVWNNYLIAQNSYGTIKYYELDTKIDFIKKKLFTTSEITITNEGYKEITSIPFILYRLLKVTSITVDGKSIPFNQEIKSFSDFDLLQVNTVIIKLSTPILNGDSIKISMSYEGSLLGYAETGLNYVKDKIDSGFTIIRPDCLSYPVLGKPQFSTLKLIGSQSFNYKIKVNVPDSLFVVNGGLLTNKTSINNHTTYTYKSLKSTYQIVTAIAKYRKLTTHNISTFYFEKDSTNAKKVHNVLLNTFELYSKWWGKLRGKNIFSLIETPEGYGSQATENYVIQTADAFNKSNQLRQLYHEISHLWNVKSSDKYPSRWNEGLATFIEYKTMEELEKKNILEDEVTKLYKAIKSDEKYGNIPFVDYGKKNITDRSYKTGFLFFYLLHKIVEEERFNKIIQSFYVKYYESGATLKDFENHSMKVSRINLSKLFNDWIFTTNFHNYLKEGIPISELIKNYRLD